MNIWKNAKILILNALSTSPKTWTEILQETKLSRPVVSEHLKSMQADDLIQLLPSPSKRGARYDITPKGRELVLREEDRKFNDESPFFRAYDLEPTLPSVAETRRFTEDPPASPELDFPLFPLPIRAVLRMNTNGTYAIEAYLQRMKLKYPHPSSEVMAEWTEDWYKEIAYHFADSMIEKLCQVLFERTRVLCGLHIRGEKGSLPTLDNILNFSFEFICRYEGDKLLKSASREERANAQHLLAGTLLLYLLGSGKGPIETFVWEKKQLETLVESGLLTREEIKPFLEVCRLAHWDGPPIEGRSSVLLEQELLTDEQRREITRSAYRHFQFVVEEYWSKRWEKEKRVQEES